MEIAKQRGFRRMAIAICAMWACGNSADGYQLAARWTNTANGASGPLGSPISLTWSLMPDGASIDGIGASNLISFLDTNLGSGPGGTDLTGRPWFPYFQESFDRWSELSGLTFSYEPHDDGVPHGNFPGVLGTRGDIRIGGGFIDGDGAIAGYNFLPNNGDMVLDTADVTLVTNPESNHLRFRTILMHELGHGLGFSHVNSADASFLMEAFFTYLFDGPQVDDIRGIHRAYGDALEKNNAGAGNDSYFNAISLGTLSDGLTVSIGTATDNGTSVLPNETDFVSIDDNSDLDYYAFELSQTGVIEATLTPVGPTYLEGPLGGQQATVNAAAISNLGLAVFDTDGVRILGNANLNGPGVAEQIRNLTLGPGRYFARVSGNADDVQLYRLDLTATFVPEPGSVGLWMAIGLWGMLRRDPIAIRLSVA